MLTTREHPASPPELTRRVRETSPRRDCAMRVKSPRVREDWEGPGHIAGNLARSQPDEVIRMRWWRSAARPVALPDRQVVITFTDPLDAATAPALTARVTRAAASAHVLLD